MKVSPDALRFVLGQGLPAITDVRTGSMLPAIGPGDRLSIAPLAGAAAATAVRAGDIVLIATEGGELVLHRVMHLFEEAGATWIAHQGDSPGATFAVCPRASVIGRAVGFAADPARPLPTLEHMDLSARLRFGRRRTAVAVYCRLRAVARRLRLADRKLVRDAARMLRRLARGL